MKHMIFSIFVAPWQETFADAGDGDGGGGPFFSIPKVKIKNSTAAAVEF